MITYLPIKNDIYAYPIVYSPHISLPAGSKVLTTWKRLQDRLAAKQKETALHESNDEAGIGEILDII